MPDDIASTANEVYRDYVTDGVPASGPNDPAKGDIRALWAQAAAALADITTFAGPTVFFDTKAHMDADLVHAAGTPALVYDDGTAANDGIYIKSGGSGSGSWVATGIVLSGSVAGDLSTLQGDVATNTSDIASLKTSRTADETTLAGHTTSIGANTTDVASLKTSRTADEATLASHTTSIGTNTSDIAGLKTSRTADEATLSATSTLATTTAAQVNIDVDPGNDAPVLVDADGETIWAADYAGRFLGELSPDHTHAQISALDFVTALAVADPGDDVALIETLDGQPILGVGYDGRILLPGADDGGGGGGGVAVLAPDGLGDIDAWQVLQNGALSYYEAMRWGDFPRGYVTDGTHHVAQTGSTVFGLVNAGSTLRSSGGVSTAIYHVTEGSSFSPADGCNSAFGESLIADRLADARALPSIDCLDGGIASATLADLTDADAYGSFLAAIDGQRLAWLGFGKAYAVAAVIVSQGLAEMDADEATYAAAFNAYLAALPVDIGAASDQPGVPLVFYHQTSGTAVSGADNAALGQITAYTFGPTLVTPLYPFAIDPLSAATPTDDSILLIGELERLAYDTVAGSQEWRPPVPVTAILSGSTITVQMDALSDLVLDTGRTITHEGFALDGVTNGKTITGVSVADQDVTITLSGAPTGTLVLRYAWGETTPVSDGFVCNRGNLRDSYGQASALVGGHTLRRFAVGFQINVS